MRMVFGLVLLVGIALAGGAVYLAKDRIAQYQNANAQAQAAAYKEDSIDSALWHPTTLWTMIRKWEGLVAKGRPGSRQFHHRAGLGV